MVKAERELNVDRELRDAIANLPPAAKREVLDYVRLIGGPSVGGPSGRGLLRFVGTMSPEEGKEILDAIEEGCRRVDQHGW